MAKNMVLTYLHFRILKISHWMMVSFFFKQVFKQVRSRAGKSSHMFTLRRRTTGRNSYVVFLLASHCKFSTQQSQKKTALGFSLLKGNAARMNVWRIASKSMPLFPGNFFARDNASKIILQDPWFRYILHTDPTFFFSHRPRKNKASPETLKTADSSVQPFIFPCFSMFFPKQCGHTWVSQGSHRVRCRAKVGISGRISSP